MENFGGRSQQDVGSDAGQYPEVMKGSSRIPRRLGLDEGFGDKRRRIKDLAGAEINEEGKWYVLVVIRE